MRAWLRRLIKIEDVLWAVWLLALRPASGGLLLEGGATTVFLAIAVGLYWVTGVLAEEGGGPRSGLVLLMSLGLCSVVMQAGLEQLGAPQVVVEAHAIVVMGLAALLIVQHLTTGGRTWWTLPRPVRRVLTWPLVMAMAEVFGQMLAGFVGLAKVGDGVGFLVIVFAAVMPMLYAFFVASLRLVADPRETMDWRVWAGRYLVALACALVGVFVVRPALGWIGFTGV